MNWNHITSITATLSTDTDPSTGTRIETTPKAIIDYLNENPRHAITIHDLNEESGECTAHNPQYILRGASEELNNYYYGPVPAEDPNDASGGDLTAEEALKEALDALCSS